MSTSQDRDHLTSLPSEILIKALSNVPLSSFLDLTHTSHGLRSFVKTNAARICDAAIESRYAFKNKALQPIRLSDGQSWLGLSVSEIVDKEERYKRILQDFLQAKPHNIIKRSRKNNSFKRNIIGSNDADCSDIVKVELFNLAGELNSTDCGVSNFIGLTTPGPQYLHVFEQMEREALASPPMFVFLRDIAKVPVRAISHSS